MTNRLISHDEEWHAPLSHKKGHLHRELEDPESVKNLSAKHAPKKISIAKKTGNLCRGWEKSKSLYTRGELEKLHRRFAHPSAKKLHNLLKKAALEQADASARKLLEDIAKKCEPCQRLSPKPCVLQITLPEDMQLNHEAFADAFFMRKKPALHAIDRGAHFSAAKFMPSSSTEEIWNTFIECWASIYVGFPSALSCDQKSAFTSALFQKACKHLGITAKPAPTEAHHALPARERYHGPLRRIYRKIKIECPSLDDKVTFSIATKALNDTAGPEVLTPTLLAFGMMPKIPLGYAQNTAPSQRERFAAIELARKEMEALTAELRVKIAKFKRAPTLEALNLEAGDPV